MLLVSNVMHTGYRILKPGQIMQVRLGLNFGPDYIIASKVWVCMCRSPIISKNVLPLNESGVSTSTKLIKVNFASVCRQ